MFKSTAIALVLTVAVLSTGCGMGMTDEQRTAYVEERDAIEVLMGAVSDPDMLVEMRATIDRINKRLEEGDKGWSVVEGLLMTLGPLIPGVGGVIAMQRKRARGLVTGLFSMIDHAGGKDGKFDHSLARELMDADPRLRAYYQQFRASQAVAEGAENAHKFKI